MAKTHITNKNTTKPRLIGLGALALSLAATYGLVQLGSSMSTSMDNGNKRDAVESAIDEKNYGIADALLEDFQGTPEDKTALEVILRQSKLIDKFDSAINGYDEPTASDIISQMRSSGEYSAEKLDSLETQVKGISESDMYKQIFVAQNQDKSLLCQKYLEVYPDGAHSSEVSNDLIHNELELLYESLSNGEGFSRVYNRVRSLNMLLKEQNLQGFDLPSKEFYSEENIEEYLKIQCEEEFSLGDSAKFVIQNQGNFFDSYYLERNSLIEIGAVGEVVHVGDLRVILRIQDVEDIEWTREWVPEKEYWGEGTRNAAEFQKTELKIIAEISEFDKEKLRKEMADMRLVLYSE